MIDTSGASSRSSINRFAALQEADSAVNSSKAAMATASNSPAVHFAEDPAFAYPSVGSGCPSVDASVPLTPAPEDRDMEMVDADASSPPTSTLPATGPTTTTDPSMPSVTIDKQRELSPQSTPSVANGTVATSTPQSNLAPSTQRDVNPYRRSG